MVNVVALHGFWGAPDDFDGLLNSYRLFTPNLFAPGPLDPTHDLATWTGNFLAELDAVFDGEPAILIGYSQGARLALHALIRRPAAFERAILASVHPGQLSDPERAARTLWIWKWQRQFLEASWDQLDHAWNAQEIFAGDVGKKSRPSRELLAAALANWSLLEHRFGWRELQELTVPVDWVFGGKDCKFLAVKEELKRHNVPGRFHVIEGAGHRLLQDAPKELSKLLRKDPICPNSLNSVPPTTRRSL